MPPFPQFNVATSLCLERPSKKTAISVWMLACIGQQHWSRGHGGIRCDVTACRRMDVFFEEPGEDFLVYGCANTSLNKPPFAFAKTSLQTHFHLHSFYPANKEAQNLSFWAYGFATQAWTNSLLHVPKPNPNTLSSSQLLPINKDATLQHLLRMWAKIVDRKLCVLHGALM